MRRWKSSDSDVSDDERDDERDDDGRDDGLLLTVTGSSCGQ